MTVEGRIVEAVREGKRVKYTAEYPDGRQVSGVFTNRVAGAVLTEEGLQTLVEEMVGTTVELPEQPGMDVDERAREVFDDAE